MAHIVGLHGLIVGNVIRVVHRFMVKAEIFLPDEDDRINHDFVTVYGSKDVLDAIYRSVQVIT